MHVPGTAVAIDPAQNVITPSSRWKSHRTGNIRAQRTNVSTSFSKSEAGWGFEANSSQDCTLDFK